MSLGYGWLLRGTYGLMAVGALVTGLRYGEPVPVRDVASVGVVLGHRWSALVVSVAAPQGGRGRRARARGGAQRPRHRDDRHRAPARRPATPTPPEFPPVLDLLAPAIGLVGLVAGGHRRRRPGRAVGRPGASSGAAFLGAVTDAMLLGHWYLVQPGMPRGPLLELVRWLGRASGRSRWS